MSFKNSITFSNNSCIIAFIDLCWPMLTKFKYIGLQVLESGNKMLTTCTFCNINVRMAGKIERIWPHGFPPVWFLNLSNNCCVLDWICLFIYFLCRLACKWWRNIKKGIYWDWAGGFADSVLILFHWTNIPLPLMRSQSTDLLPMCGFFHTVYCMHVWVKWIPRFSFYLPAALIRVNDLKDLARRFHLSLLAPPLCLAHSLISQLSHSVHLTSSFSLRFSPAFLFSAEIMSPYSASALVERSPLFLPTCLAGL